MGRGNKSTRMRHLAGTRDDRISWNGVGGIMKHWILAVAAVTLVAGCASPPNTHYYTLDLTPGNAASPAPVKVAIDSLRPSQALRRGEIMIKRSPTEVEYYAEHEWAADVEEIVTHKLNAELPRVAEGSPVINVSGEVLAFEQVDGPDGYRPHVKLHLEFRTPSMNRYDEPLLEGDYENDYREEPPVAPASAAVDETARAIVEALSGRLAALAPAIVVDAQKAAQIAQEREEKK